jgi:hypothetical protein
MIAWSEDFLNHAESFDNIREVRPLRGILFPAFNHDLYQFFGTVLRQLSHAWSLLEINDPIHDLVRI